MNPSVVHLDESCLGNGMEGDNPGGAGGLVEIRPKAGGGIERRDFFISSPATTNNRMALAGAIGVLQLLGRKGARLRLLVVSDSEYLVRGVREWLPGWIARGWKRKGGAIENLELWQALHQSLALHEVQLAWVRGHSGHPKNEYANDLAMRAARNQETSAGIVPSGFGEWLGRKRAAGQFTEYDPDMAFAALEQRLTDGGSIPLDLNSSGTNGSG
ncbi:MAG TPA: ribonuclease H [Gemmatimonadales bacterium]|nr:ribonuclease H [Gemmatimonadales bacterium]